jgi:hypothetical protein
MQRIDWSQLYRMEGPLFKTGVLVLFLLSIVVLQFSHLLEHGLQSYQVAYLHLPASEAHGYSALLDHEYFHTTGGWIYWFATIFFFVIFQFSPEFAPIRAVRAWKYMIGVQLFGIIVQFYHQQENVMQLGQWLYSDCEPCPGFLGMHTNVLGFLVDPVYMHFWFNLVVYIPELIVFVFLIRFYGMGYFRMRTVRT